MIRLFKWIGITVGGLLGLLVLVAAGLYLSANSRMNRTYDVKPQVVAIPSDPESLRLGERWVRSLCVECHGEDLEGAVVFEDPAIGRIVASNLTAGEGGVGGGYADADWVRAIRHGIGADGRALFVMPSEAYFFFGDQDLGAMIAYLKSLPPVDHDPGEMRVTAMARLLVAAGAFVNPFAAERIDHGAPRPIAPPPGVTAEYGEYLARIGGCQSCHGSDLGGGQHPAPDGPPVPNITRGGTLAGWTEGVFLAAVEGRESEFMPWENMRNFPVDDLRAIWMYLQSVPAVE